MEEEQTNKEEEEYVANRRQILYRLSMNFVNGQPLSMGKASILFLENRLSKYADLLSLTHYCTAMEIA